MNIYYAPEKFGLKLIDSIDKAGSYEFDMFVVWQKENGDMVYGTDSGCSCPSPFESSGIADLTPYSEQALDKWAKEWEWRMPDPTEVLEMKRKVREALK